MTIPAESAIGQRRGHTSASSREAPDWIVVCDWHDTYWRERRVRIAPCPGVLPDHYPHERVVCDDPDDEGLYRPRICCSCGWVGPHAETEEQAVEAFNRPHGFGIEPLTEWIAHERACRPLGHGVEGQDDHLPF